nr:hypothetical protein [Pantoea agglomerans]
MAIVELYSKRQKRLRGDVSDVYQYTDLPHNFRVQVVQIIREILGEDYGQGSNTGNIYAAINSTLCREYGVFTLKERARSNFEAVYDFFLGTREYEKCLDIIELTFKHIIYTVAQEPWSFGLDDDEPLQAIDELNVRFRESGIGYQLEADELVRVDSQFLHSEAVKPTLQILGVNPNYEGVNDEFLSAHEHYRHHNYKECLNDCLKAFESLMKTIHTKRGWAFSQNDTAKKLINGCLTNGLIPEYMQNEFSSLRSLLESGIPTIRNKEGGHGQGHEVTKVPEHLASYALHLTASTLLFLAKCDEKL